MGLLWLKYGFIMVKILVYMVKIWLYHGYNMALSWLKYGFIMVKIWLYHG